MSVIANSKAQQANIFAQRCLQKLLQEWFDFERQLNRVAIIKRLDDKSFGLRDYRQLLLHLRQQVVEGAAWICRCASSFDSQHLSIRQKIIAHASDEHQDYRMLEQDYIAAGGKMQEIIHQEKNIGAEAFHAFMMYRASLPNPIDLLGAMWIIEGLGEKMASEWADRIEDLTGPLNHVRFLRYHAANDDAHLEKFYTLLDEVCFSEADIDRIVTTAKVVKRLYILQLENIDESA